MHIKDAVVSQLRHGNGGLDLDKLDDLVWVDEIGRPIYVVLGRHKIVITSMVQDVLGFDEDLCCRVEMER